MPPPTEAPNVDGIRPILIYASDVAPEPIEWLWKGKLALGKLNLICGEPGTNKSCFTLDLAARITNGSTMPDGSYCPQGKVIVISAEDDIADTMRPRLDAAGADVSQVVFLDGISFPAENGKKRIKSFTLDHVAVLSDAIKQVHDCRAIIIDPVSAYLSDADSHRNAEIRGLLAPLSKLASEFSVCILMVTHLNKAAGGKAMHRAMGSLAFIAASRSAWLIAKDPNSQGNERRRLFLPIKNNLGDDTAGLAFGVQGTIGQDHPSIAWEDHPVSMKADEALASPDESGSRPAVAKNAAGQWLRELLASGPMESARVKDEATAACIAWATVRRAQEDMGIKPYHCHFAGCWMWKLPEIEGAQQGAHEDAH